MNVFRLGPIYPAAAGGLFWPGQGTISGTGSLDPLGEGQLPTSSIGTKIVALGDLHGKWHVAQRILDHEFPEGNGTALAVGDFCGFPPLSGGHSIYFVHGNHDNYSEIPKLRDAKGRGQQYNPIFAGDLIDVGGVKVAGIPGVLSPHFYPLARSEAPLKYFTQTDVDAMRTIKGVDILLMHEAPHGVGFVKKGMDMGKEMLTGIIEYLKPRLVLFGHHHVFFQGMLGETRILGLDYPHRSYVVIKHDPSTGRSKLLHKMATPVGKKTPEYKYDWQLGRDDGKNTKVLLGKGPTVKKEAEIRAKLEAFRGGVEAILESYVLNELPLDMPDRETIAKLRAKLAFNDASPCAAYYAAALEADPEMSLEKRGALMKEIYDKMCGGDLVPGAVEEFIFAFQECLKVLGLVRDRRDT